MGLFDGPKLSMTISHGLAPNEVRSRLEKQLAGKLENSFPSVQLTDLRQQWSGSDGQFICQVAGHDISGDMSVRTTELAINIQLPFGASTMIDLDDTQLVIETNLKELLS